VSAAPETRLAARVARLAACLAALSAGGWFARGALVPSARADRAAATGSTTARAWHDLGVALGGSSRPGPRTLEVNGARLHVDVAANTRSIAAVLDEAEAACRADEVGRDGEARPVRDERADQGIVACQAWLSEAEVAAADGGDAPRARARGLRTVFVQRGPEGGVIVKLWAVGALDASALFPTHGDAPGVDAPGVPRPPSTRRVLSVRELGQRQQLTLYAARDGAAADLGAWYRARLPELGWRPLSTVATAPTTDVLVVDRAGSLATLVIAAEEAGQDTIAILTSL
jgi:hypothetical protein